MVLFQGCELGAGLGAREGGEPGPGTVALKQAPLPVREPLPLTSMSQVSS